MPHLKGLRVGYQEKERARARTKDDIISKEIKTINNNDTVHHCRFILTAIIHKISLVDASLEKLIFSSEEKVCAAEVEPFQNFPFTRKAARGTDYVYYKGRSHHLERDHKVG